MKCFNPRFAWYLKRDDGSYKINFLPKEFTPERALSYGKDYILEIPCGKCSACKKNYRFLWSLRCYLESLDYDRSYFLTLTYDDEHYKNASFSDIKKFLKTLRNNGYFVRYFGCSERGLLTKRLHFHLVLFGIKLDDLKLNRFNKLFSVSLNSYWSKGFVQIDEFKSGHAFYVAGYVSKKEDKESKLFMSRNLGKNRYKLIKESGSSFPFFAPGCKVPDHIKALDKLLGYDILFDDNSENNFKYRHDNLRLCIDKRNKLL